MTGSKQFRLVSTGSALFLPVMYDQLKQATTSSNRLKLVQTIETGSDWLKSVPTSSNRLQMNQIGSIQLRLVQTGLNLYLPVQIGSDRFKPVQNDTACFRHTPSGFKPANTGSNKLRPAQIA